MSANWLPGPRTLQQLTRLGNALLPLASRLPSRPAAVLIAAGLNVALARGHDGDADREPGSVGSDLNAELEPLFGKVVAIRVTDADLSFFLRVSQCGFTACGQTAPAVVIAAPAAELVRLAFRQVDADTLFFARKLTMEGNTELGLLLKNRLDALDLSWLAGSPPLPLELVQAFRRAAVPPQSRTPESL